MPNKYDKILDAYREKDAPAGSDTEMQYNDGGTLAGCESLKHDKSTGDLIIKSSVKVYLDGL